MYAVVGHDNHLYCSIECLRRRYGVLANPLRMAMHFEYNDYCDGCGTDLAVETEV